MFKFFRSATDSNIKMLFVAIGGFVILEFFILSGVINPYVNTILCYAGIVVISALGLNLIYGFTGQFSLGHAAFYGIGAYTAALLTRTISSKGLWVLPLGIIVGGLAAGATAFLIGLPILRLKSDYLGIATLGFGMIINVLLKNSDKVIKIMGGAAGMREIEKLTTFPWVFFLGLLGIIVIRNLIFSGVGRTLISIREDELAAEAVGVNASLYKTLGFIIGCMYAGVAGGLYAHLYTYLNPDNFDFLKSIDVLLIVVVGGLGSISGTIIAGTGWAFLLEGLRVILPSAVQEWRMVIYPLILIMTMLFRSRGIMGGSEFNFLKPPEYRQG
ncbi:MAG: branched-chain amino acid ABC transporter permease [bacterium]